MHHETFSRGRVRHALSGFVLLALASVLSACGGGGGGGGGAAAATAARYAFVANFHDNSVSTYVVDGTTGRLRWIGKVAAGTNPHAVAIDPSGKYAYVVNYYDGTGGDSVSQYTINADGSLTAMSPATVAAGRNPMSVMVDPSGKYAYVVNQYDNSVSMYTIGSDGSLSPLIPSGGTTNTVATGAGPQYIVIAPSGKYAYLVNWISNSVSMYTIGSDGSLSPLVPSGGTTNTVATGNYPWSLTIAPSGKFAYVVNLSDSTVGQYTIGSDGSLSPLIASGGTTNTVATGYGPYSMVVDPSGKYAYVSNFYDSDVSQYTIGSDGSLSPLIPSGGTTNTVAAGANPYFISIDPSGKYVYAADSTSNTVLQYSIGSDGSLTPVSPGTAPAYGGPVSLAMTHGAAVQAVPQYAYVANYGGGVSMYTIGSDGSLSDLIPGGGTTNLATAGTYPQSVTVGPAGKYAYVADFGSDEVSQFTIGSDGSLVATSGAATGSSPISVAIDPAGRYAYAANWGDKTVSQYTVGSDGSLTALIPSGGTTNTVAAGTNPYSVTVDPSGKYVYVANRGDNDVSMYTIGSDGSLTSLIPSGGTTNTVAAGTYPVSVTVDPSGKYVYVANGGGSVMQYAIGPDGSLTAMSTATAGSGAISVAVDPAGKYAYVAQNVSSGPVSQYTIGSDGSLTAMSTASVMAGSYPASVTVDPSGKYVYVANYSDSTVSQFTVGSDGSLGAMSTASVATGGNPESVCTAGTWK